MKAPTPRTYQSYRSTFANTPAPFAFVDLDLLEANIAQVLSYSGDKPVRLGSKSIRCVAIMKRIMATDPRFRGVLCFTAAEALWLFEQGFKDLLVAYPTWNPAQLRAVAEHSHEAPEITLMADCMEHLDHYERAAREVGGIIRVCLDLDMGTSHLGLHFGALRTTLREPDDLLVLGKRVLASPHLELDGLMGYEGQIAGTADAVPGQRAMNLMKRALKRASSSEVVERRAALARAIEALDAPLRFINAGGSGSLKLNATEDAVTEVTAGSAFYGPLLFGHHADYTYYPAAGFAIPIVRRPAPDVFTCLGGGYTSSGAGGAETLPRPHLPAGAKLTPFEGAGEVQTPIKYRGEETLSLGDPIFMRHAKAGELCERFDRLHLCRGEQVVEEVLTYRGQGQCFL